ncbi:MAG: Na+/H+ antiporter NhaA [Solirubrobacteraceae bacterium]
MTVAAARRTAWARNLAAPVRDFLSTETGGAVALLGAIVVALAWANTFSDSYDSVWHTELSLRLGDWSLRADLRDWINEGLMTFFFLVVGLEAKRELDLGELRERRRLASPVIGAVGGVLGAVGIYLVINAGADGAAHGWGAAMSTDTAFALGVLALIVPQGTRLRVWLLSLAVVDDLIALLVIATVYTKDVSVVALAIALALFAVLVALRFAPARWRREAAAVVGVALWIALFRSGIDPVVAGLAVGLVTSAYPPARADLERVTAITRSFREQPTPELAREAQRGVASAISPNERIQYRLHPWTSYVIVPLFALANAGVEFRPGLFSDALSSPIALGIVAGYVIGKPLGILVASWVATRRRLGGLRLSLSWPALSGGATVAGVGFTVSVLVASRAFTGRDLEEAKIGVLAAAVLASLACFAVTRVYRRLPEAFRARQIAGTRAELLDLSDEVDAGRDHIRGPDEAPVTLLEYGDFECPYCGQAESAVRELLRSFGADLRYAFRHLPLADVHPNAQMAAEASEAAAAQGRFWEMHDALFDHQDALTPAALRRYAQDLGLDVERFWDEVRTREHAPRVAEDVRSADESGVAGTPTFFINGRRHQGAYDVDTLTTAVRRAHARARLAAAA